MEPVYRVALLVDANNPQGREFAEGIAGFRSEGSAWSICLCPTPVERGIELLRSGACDGAIVHVESDRDRELLPVPGLPAVLIDDAPADADANIGSVGVDQRAVGRLAGEHLAGLGLRETAMCQREGGLFCGSRRAGFIEAVRAASGEVAPELAIDPALDAAQIVQRMIDWLTDLPKPIGVFACDDFGALHVLEAAKRAGLSVPDQVAVLGANDDKLLTKLADPPLSSVQVPLQAVGYEAARMLQEFMAGRTPADRRVTYSPIDVASRRSTDVLTVADQDLVDAIKFIRERAHTPIQVVDVLEKVPVSRRSLERRFRQYLGRSPQQEIQRVRLEKARSLLADSDRPIHEVATQSGFHDPDRMAAVFRKVVGMTPSDYRNQFRRR